MAPSCFQYRMIVHRWVLNVNPRALNEIRSKHISPFFIDHAVKSLCWKNSGENMAANNPHMLMASVGLYSEATRVRPNNNRPNEPIGFASHSCNLYIPWRSRTEYSDKYIRKLHISTYDMTIACRILQICIYIYVYIYMIYIYIYMHT